MAAASNNGRAAFGVDFGLYDNNIELALFVVVSCFYQRVGFAAVHRAVLKVNLCHGF